MFTLEQFRSYLEAFFPSDGMADHALNGLQVQGKRDIVRACTAVSASLVTIEEAVKQGADALIVHHGLFWHRDSFIIEGTKKNKLQRLFDHGISLFAYHLPLDKHPEIGNNWKAARDLEWFDLHPFGCLNGISIGVKGKVRPCSREALKNRLETYYRHPAVCAWGGVEEIQTVALVSGGAHKTMIEAAQQRIDAYITGSFDEPIWDQAKEEGINFYALGHAATERVGPMALADHLMKVLNLPCLFIDVENPF